MFSIFWRTLFSISMILFLVMNIALTFDVLQILNPSALTLENGDSYSNYYFGFSSFIDCFQNFFADNNSLLKSFQDWLSEFGAKVSYIFTHWISNFKANNIGTSGSTGSVLKAIIYILLLLLSGVGLMILFVYGLCFILYLICFLFYLVGFVMAFAGGAFRTPLPSTEWWDSVPQYTQTLAMLV